MVRLGFALGLAAILASAGSLSATSALRFDQKLSKDKQAVHALNRLTFGPRPGDIERVRRLGVEQWIRQQLQPQLIPADPALDARLQALETLHLPTWQILESYQPPTPVVSLLVRPTPLAQLLPADQVRMLTTGTAEQRLAVLASVPS